MMRNVLRSPTWRPYLLLVVVVAMLAVVDGGQGRFLNRATAFSVLQQFSTLGPFALGLGLSMIIREFDISIAGMLSLAGCIAVIVGQSNAGLGLLAALALGVASGLLNGVLTLKLRLASVGVTLGSLLTLSGLAYVITGNEVVGYTNTHATQFVNMPLLGIFTIRSVAAIAMFGIAIVIMQTTRWGRDIVAVGSDRRAALVAGVRVSAIIAAVFAVSGMLTALAGALLSFSLAAASPIALANVLVPAAAAAIMGGVSLAGGRGTPAGIAGGVLLLSTIRSGLTAVAAPPYLQDVVSGAVLLGVALLDAPDLGAALSRSMGRFGRFGRPVEEAEARA